MTTSACSGGERGVNDVMTDVLQDAHNLSPCAAGFCDGDLSRYLELYDLVFQSPSEGSNNDKTILLTWRGWFADMFQSLRQATQH